MTDPHVNVYPGAIKMLNENTGYITYGTNSTWPGDRTAKTIEGGINLVEISNEVGGNKLHFINQNTVFGIRRFPTLGSRRTILSKTTDACVNWTYQFVDEFFLDITFINEQTGFIVGDYGMLLKTTNGGAPISVQNISTEIPDQFELAQNYPNPFNPITTIRFSIPRATPVTLSVYDLTGKEVFQLVNEQLSAGTYAYDFHAKGLTSGVYFYRLNTEDHAMSRKMVLLK